MRVSEVHWKELQAIFTSAHSTVSLNWAQHTSFNHKSLTWLMSRDIWNVFVSTCSFMCLFFRINTDISKIEIIPCECTKNLSVKTYYGVLECHCLVTLQFMLFYYRFVFMSLLLSTECWSSSGVCNTCCLCIFIAVFCVTL